MSRGDRLRTLGRVARRRLQRPLRSSHPHVPAARRQKAGLPPGTVVHTGTRYMEEASIDVISWAGDELVEEHGVSLARAVELHRGAQVAGRATWIDVRGLHDTALIEGLGEAFTLHPLTLEDVASVGQRPKFESYEGYVFLVARMLSLRSSSDEPGVRRRRHRRDGRDVEADTAPDAPAAPADPVEPVGPTTAAIGAGVPNASLEGVPGAATEEALSTVELDNEQVALVLLPDVLITFQERPGDVFEPVRERLRGGKGRIRSRGPDYLAYALFDVLIDASFGILERYGDEAEWLEDEIFADPHPTQLVELQRLRRDALELRRAVWPLRDVLSSLSRDEGGLVTDPVRTFVRDALDHAVQAIDAVETLRELLAGLHDAYLSGVSHRMNEVMKVLTVIATIFIPLGFLAGVYGMNFAFMPELAWRWSYPIVWLVFIGLATGMLAWFRRRGWL